MLQRRIHSSLFQQQQPECLYRNTMKEKLRLIPCPNFSGVCNTDGLLWAVEDNSAALLTRQSGFLQMVINELQHRVHRSALTALTVMPHPGDVAVFSQMCYIWSRCRRHVAAKGSTHPLLHTVRLIRHLSNSMTNSLSDNRNQYVRVP